MWRTRIHLQQAGDLHRAATSSVRPRFQCGSNSHCCFNQTQTRSTAQTTRLGRIRQATCVSCLPSHIHPHRSIHTSSHPSNTSATGPAALSLDDVAISASQLASYASLLPKGAIEEKYLNPVKAIVVEVLEEEMKEHRPLRTKLKSDMKFAIPSIDPHNLQRTLPFSLATYRQLLFSPCAFEIARAQSNSITGSTDQAQLTSSSATEQTNNNRQLIDSAELERVIKEVTTPNEQQFTTLTKWMAERKYSHVLTLQNELFFRRHDHRTVCDIYQAIIRPHAESVISLLDSYTHNNSTTSTTTSASTVLEFLSSLHRPKLLDHSAALTLSSSMQVKDTALAREVVSKVARWQRAQSEAFEAVQWAFGVEITQASNTAQDILKQAEKFNPYDPHPYMAFMESLMNTNSDDLATARGRKKRRLKQQAKKQQQQLTPTNTTPSTAVASQPPTQLPKVKPALQLFNRLVDPPSSAGDAAYQLSWNRLMKNMMDGVVTVAGNEARELRQKHAAIFRAANNRPKSVHELDPLSEFTLVEVMAVLQDVTTKKREALELVEGIAMHVLRSFVAAKKVETPAQPTEQPTAPPSLPSSTPPTNETTPPQITQSTSQITNTPASSSGHTEVAASSSPPAAVTPAAPPARVSSSKSFSNHESWRLIKLLLCSTDSLHRATSNRSSSPSTKASTHSGEAWKAREGVAMSLQQIQQQREQIRETLIAYHPRFDQKFLEARQYKQTSELQQFAHKMKSLQDQHRRLLHTTLEAFIHVAQDFSELEGLNERLRVRSEYLIAKRLHELQREEAGGLVEKGSYDSFKTRSDALHAIAFPPSPARTLHRVLTYLTTESVTLDRHSLTLLFHKGLFGGGIRPSVRYETFTRPGFSIDPKVSGMDDEFSQVLGMLQSCSPAFRRIPAKVKGATSDFISSLIIDHLLPRPISLYDSPPKNINAEQAHSKLLEAYSTASMNVLEKQHRRVWKEERLDAARKTAVTPANPTTDVTSPNKRPWHDSDTSLISNFPFTLLRDNSGVLARLQGTLEFIHSHPVNPKLDRYNAVRQVGGGTRSWLSSAYLAHLRFGNNLRLSQQAYADWQLKFSKQKKRGGLARDFHPSRLQRRRLRQIQYKSARRSLPRVGGRLGPWTEAFRTKHLQLFGKSVWNKKLNAPDVSQVEHSYMQVPSWIVPQRVYSELLIYHDRCNDLPSAVNVLDRMIYQWITPTFEASLALMSLAAKFMNYELLVYYFQRYALPLSDNSPAKRSQIWRTLLHGLSRYNSYSNIDSYMRYLQELLLTYLLKGNQPTKFTVPDLDSTSSTANPALSMIEEETARILGITPDSPPSSTSTPTPSSSPSPSTALVPSGPKYRPVGSTMRKSFNKRILDQVWRAWVMRGGASEVLTSWTAIRKEQQQLKLNQMSNGLKLETQQQLLTLLDSASIDAYLDGMLIPPPVGKDAVVPLNSNQLLDATGGLLRHLVAHGIPLTPPQINRLAIDLPLQLSHLRGVSTEEALMNSFTGGSRPLRSFGLLTGISDSLVQIALSNAPHITHQQMTEAIRSATTLHSSSFMDDSHLGSLTPTSLRVHTLVNQLNDLNRMIGEQGLDRSIERVTQILNKKEEEEK